MSVAIHKMRGSANVTIVGEVAGNVSPDTGGEITHALGNINVGPSSSDKNAILGITWSHSSQRQISSLTIGGVGLSEVTRAETGGTEETTAAIWAGDISAVSGSQAISVTFDGITDSAGVSGVALARLDSLTETNSDTDFTLINAEIIVTNLAALSGGIAFAVGADDTRAATASWGSLTEKADAQTGAGGGDHRHTAAWDLGLRAAANETLSFSGGNDAAVAGAGFR